IITEYKPWVCKLTFCVQFLKVHLLYRRGYFQNLVFAISFAKQTLFFENWIKATLKARNIQVIQHTTLVVCVRTF
ncbi:hypothetical protein JQK62_18395, partial [Leptospira santarosai]|nr:hypothetical protein [Leptospira santarosai]